MAHTQFQLTIGPPNIVGSFGSPGDLRDASAIGVATACDIAEIRLDMLLAESTAVAPEKWHHLRDTPLLFTARRKEEGGAIPLNPAERMGLLKMAIDHAACIDIEVASIDEMSGLISGLTVPWIASFHDFEKLPDSTTLAEAAKRAKAAGAAVFKLAAKLNQTSDLARLADFQLSDHGIPVSTMGMGALAPVSRLLCAQCGSVLNYGYLGKTPTAPGQWDAALLKQTVSRLVPFGG